MTIEHPAVSVVIAARDASKTLGESIESLQTQRMSRWEAVIVDDGSSDETVEIARLHASRDARIRVVTQEPRGAGPARNVGIRICRAEWLLFLDADDLLEPGHLDSMLAAAGNQAEGALVMCGWARFGPGGERIATHQPPIDAELFPAFARTCPVAINSVLVRKACVWDVGGFDESLHTCWDWDLWQRIARTGATSTSIPDILAL
jgi:glycosyltransferase involved in cell wall biosynthesis